MPAWEGPGVGKDNNKTVIIMTRVFVFSLVFLLGLYSAQSAEVPQPVAEQAALRFISEKAVTASEAVTTQFSVKEVTSIPKAGDPLYYIFNLSPQGWIIISADDAVPPVLAYSYQGSYSVDQAPEQCTAWMRQYEDQIRYARDNHIAPFSYTHWLWDDLVAPRPPSSVSHSPLSVAPLITSNWNQNFPYNAACPSDPAGPGGHAYAGCVPTCMGQVMYYFRWPQTGTGSYSYYDSTYGTLSAHFDTTHYDWNRMTDVADHVNPAIATLLFHLGVSCDLVYGPNGSGMYNHKAAYALRTFFKYSPQTQYLFRDSTTLSWDSVLIAHLDRKIPMYYAGWSTPNIDGHAFVCDGYQDSCFFHFNFGWSGSNNGYFYTSDLTPGGYNFQLAQEVIINCYPDTSQYTYPEYCTGYSELRSMEGTFDDGSGPVQNYAPNSVCQWLITPQTEKDSVSSITLNFGRFSTNPGDEVKIYDGSSDSSPLLASISGDTLPQSVTSTGNKLFVTFTSSMGPGAPGFFAGYSSASPVWCSGTTEITADTAEISDGSFGFDYHNGQLCKWKVTKASGGPLTLYFRSFNTEEGKDLLKIYDFATSTMITQLSGHYGTDSVPAPVTVESGVAFLIFNSGSSGTDSGWDLYYPKSTQAIEENGSSITMKVYPNPAEDRLNISIKTKTGFCGRLKILDGMGKVVKESQIAFKPGLDDIEFDISDLARGIYFLQFFGETGNCSEKFVKL